MFERFNDAARRVVVCSNEEARGMGHNYIGTEHLLLALIREDSGAAQALTGFHVGLPFTRAYIQERVEPGGVILSGHLPYNPRCKNAFEGALRSALDLGHNWIGPEHLLLGLTLKWDLTDPAIAVLETDYGIDRTQLRHEIVRLLPDGTRRQPRDTLVMRDPAEADPIGLVDVSAPGPSDEIDVGRLEERLSRLVSSWTATYQGDDVSISVTDDSPTNFWWDQSERQCTSYATALEDVVKEVERAQRLDALSKMLVPARALCDSDPVAVDGNPVVAPLTRVMLGQVIDTVLAEAHRLGYHGFDRDKTAVTAA